MSRAARTHTDCVPAHDLLTGEGDATGYTWAPGTYLEASGPVNKVEVQVVQLQVAERLLAGAFHQVLLMERAPQLKPAREQVLPCVPEALSRPGARQLGDRELAFLSPQPTHFTVTL